MADLGVKPSFWQGKRIFLTGHTGFKGGWMSLWLQQLGAVVSGYALAPASHMNLYRLAEVSNGMESQIGDIRHYDELRSAVVAACPDIVLHFAAQPLVRTSFASPLETYSTNFMGTANLLESCRLVDGLRVVLVITTDKVYQNLNHWSPYRETDPLGGVDPYSASKAACELLVSSYRESFLRNTSVAVASARAGNVIGGGDWSVDRLLPDAIRAWYTGGQLMIRRPNAVRPWQHVLEPLWGYLRLVEELWANPDLAGGFNFGPNPADAVSVKTVVEIARQYVDNPSVEYGSSISGPQESERLLLDNTKARELLDVRPVWSLETAVCRTMQWYSACRLGADCRQLCLNDIESYMRDLVRV
jgi:CDP-glucose 4,6-dehydratase